MLNDILLRLADAMALTVDAPFTNILDLGEISPARQIGTGEPMVLVLQVGVAASHADNDETYQFILQQSDNEDLSSADDILVRTIVYTDLAANRIHYLPIPPGTPSKRYLGGYFNGGGTTPTVTVTAFIQPQSMVESRQFYPSLSKIL